MLALDNIHRFGPDSALTGAAVTLTADHRRELLGRTPEDRAFDEAARLLEQHGLLPDHEVVPGAIVQDGDRFRCSYHVPAL